MAQSYEPTTWAKGDKITAERLNKMEQGIKNQQVGPQGPPGPAGAPGPAGTPGVGLTGAAEAITKIDTPDTALSADIAKKLNQLIDSLKKRGVIK